MIVYLNNHHPRNRISRLFLEKRIKKILRHLNRPKAVLGITFVTDRFIARLNQSYLKKKGSTDVLSFPMDSGNLLGDVVVSVDTAKKAARRKGKSLRDEYLFLIIHGILHLLGYDHVKHKDWVRMRKKEEELWKLVACISK